MYIFKNQNCLILILSCLLPRCIVRVSFCCLSLFVFLFSFRGINSMVVRKDDEGGVGAMVEWISMDSVSIVFGTSEPDIVDPVKCKAEAYKTQCFWYEPIRSKSNRVLIVVVDSMSSLRYCDHFRHQLRRLFVVAKYTFCCWRLILYVGKTYSTNDT